MNLVHKSVLDYGIDQTIDLLNTGFSDYLVPVHMDEQGFYNMLRMDGIDVALSQVFTKNGVGVGAALIARRGWSCRLGAMAIIPESRGEGVGTRMMQKLISQAMNRGDHRMELEVIVGNDPAISLYQKSQFQVIRKLHSFKLEKPTGIKSDFQIIDIKDIAKQVSVHGLPNLPWQISAETITNYGFPNIGICKNYTWAVISSPKKEQIHLRTLVTHPNFSDQEDPADLFRTLFAQYPEKTWIVPAIFPEEMTELFKSVDFQQQPLSQYQMALDLSTM